MRIGVIDIGTNTILHLIADVDANGGIATVHQGYEVARLGKGVDEHRSIPPETMDRVGLAIEKFLATTKQYNADRIVACGTSALRDSGNRDEFVRFVKSRFGIDVKILTGSEEAEMTYLGAISEFPESWNAPNVVVDIGGGSTEVTVGNGKTVSRSVSLEIGCVRLTERYLKSSPPSSLDMSDTLRAIRSHIQGLSEISSAATLFGVAGTVTTLAAIELGLAEYDAAKISGHELSMETIQGIFNRLRIKTVDEIKTYPQIHPGRADILLAGIIILIEVMKQLDTQTIIASDRGLRYGFALREAL